MENAYMTYDGKIRVDSYIIIVSMWNKYIEEEGRDNKVSFNGKEFFEKNFDNAYDAAMAVSLSKRWSWTDDYVYFDADGYLVSFSRCDDETCPIDLDKIDIDYLIRSLQDLQARAGEKARAKNGYVVDNIPRAIHEALQE